MSIQKAPFYEYQLKDPFDETFILAGTLAWNKLYHEMLSDCLSLDKTKKFIILGDEQLEKLPNLRIVRQEKRAAKVIQLGELSNIHISLICQSIATLSDVSTLVLLDDTLSIKENLSDYLKRIRDGQTIQFAEIEASVKFNEADVPKLFLEHSKEHYSYNKETKQFYCYEQAIWKPIDEYQLTSRLISFLKTVKAKYTKKQLDNYLSLLRYDVPLMQTSKRDLIGFSDIVIDRVTGEILEHSPDNWLFSVLPFPYQNKQQESPYFNRWLNFTCDNNENKKSVLLALLYMVLSNRYDWQLFIEITGEGATGKSVLTDICMQMVGLDNVISLNLNNLDNPKERYPIKDKLLIICPDQPSYKIIGSGLKAITGGDLIRVEPIFWSLLTAVRPAEVVSVEWSEIDWENCVWHIPKEKMKDRQNEKKPHTVPLCKQAIWVLEEMKK